METQPIKAIAFRFFGDGTGFAGNRYQELSLVKRDQGTHPMAQLKNHVWSHPMAGFKNHVWSGHSLGNEAHQSLPIVCNPARVVEETALAPVLLSMTHFRGIQVYCDCLFLVK